MFAKLFVAVLVVAGTGRAAEKAAPTGCCAVKAGCCAKSAPCCSAPAKAGCCARGKSCCGVRACCAAARAEKPDPAATKVKTARAAHEATFEAFRSGKADADKVYLWSRRWMEAQRDQGGKKADPATAIKDHLARMKVLRRFALERYKAGQTTPADVLGADFYIAEAEVWLTQAKVQ